jgi:tRNA threonylcarbamoyladenosine biosynthesis protein TsaB
MALGTSGRLIAQAELAGARRHASGLLGLLDQVLSMANGADGEIEGIVVGDGPGGFTGLRIGATVAKGLIRAQRRPLWKVASLRALAVAHAPSADRLVVALGDALRGEVYATAIRHGTAGIETLIAPSVWHPERLAAHCTSPDLIVLRPEGPRLVPVEWSGIAQVIAAPMAADLLNLVGRAGGAERVLDPHGWEPEYGRPAEAQARWEATHGRRLPDSPGQLG